MLGVDPYWERIHLAYQYEVQKRTEAHLQNNTVFYPGEIAYIEDDGSLTAAFYDFLEWQGISLNRKEMIIKQKLSLQSCSRVCVILQRLDDNRYIICYITSFHQAQHGHRIQGLLAQLFAIAMDDTPEYPPGTPSIKIQPKWEGHGFLYAIPVPRQNLRRHKAIRLRFMLRMGELERLKQLIVERVKIFKSHHVYIRKDNLRRRSLFSLAPTPKRIADALVDEGADNTADEPTTLAAIADDFETPESTPIVSTPTSSRPEGATTLSTSPPISHLQSMSRAPRRLPRVHYLETNKHWNNLRWLMKTIPRDVMNSSCDLNSSFYRHDIALGLRFYKGAASILKRLPKR